MYGISGDSRKCLAAAVSCRVDSEKVQEHRAPVNARGKNVAGSVSTLILRISVQPPGRNARNPVSHTGRSSKPAPAVNCARKSMDHILVYADSLTWGIVPNTRKRLTFDERWPGVLENKLNASSRRVRVIEDCLNGRRTVWEDPFKPGRNGRSGLAQRIEIHSPLSLVILMLGTNDFQFAHPYNDAWSAAQGVAALVNEMRQAPIEPGMPVPPVLIVCPPKIRTPQGSIAAKFRGAEQRCAGLADAYMRTASDLQCAFFDAETVTTASVIDGVHLDLDQHAKLGNALAEIVRPFLTT